MDGTLLNDDRQISERNKDSIKQAVDNGIIFTIATGRMFQSIIPFAEELELDIPLISYNGALIKEAVSKKTLYDEPVDLETSLAVLEYCRKHDYYIQAYVDDTLLVREANDYAKMYAQMSGVNFENIGDDLFKLKKAPHKLLIMTSETEHDPVKAVLTKEFGDKLVLTNSFKSFIEVMNPRVNKWNAVEALAVAKHIDPAATMCIGDSNNDFEMVSGAGIGVAVANANDRIRQAAKMVTSSNNNDGVAVAIEKILQAKNLI